MTPPLTAAEAQAMLDALPECPYCGELAVCLGRYDDMTEDAFACGNCCRHDGENGHCDPVGDGGQVAELARSVVALTEERDALADVARAARAYLGTWEAGLAPTATRADHVRMQAALAALTVALAALPTGGAP